MTIGHYLGQRLVAFAARKGFEAPPATYITGSFNLRCDDGRSLYTDEAHLWCRSCAEALLAKARPLLCEERRADHQVIETDADQEDSLPGCQKCGETLRGCLSETGAQEEIAHYDDHPIGPADAVNPKQAVEIAQLLAALPDDPDAIRIGIAALRAIRKQEERAMTDADDARELGATLPRAERAAMLEQYRTLLAGAAAVETADAQAAIAFLEGALEAEIARADRAEAAVRKAAGWFNDYAKMHRDKGAAEKAERNAERASFLERSVAAD